MHFLPFIIQGQWSSLITHFCRKSTGSDSLGMWLLCCNTSARVRNHCLRAAMREIYPFSQEGKHHSEMKTPLFIAFCVSRVIIRVARNTFPGLSSFCFWDLAVCSLLDALNLAFFLFIYFFSEESIPLKSIKNVSDVRRSHTTKEKKTYLSTFYYNSQFPSSLPFPPSQSFINEKKKKLRAKKK